MKKKLLLLPAFLFLLLAKVFSQTVYVNQTGTTYHTDKCKLYTKNFEALPLWKAQGPYGKRPCDKCRPPIKETKAAENKNPAPKPATPANK